MAIEVFAELTPPKENATDAAVERETVIVWSDADQVIQVTTSQRPKVTELMANPSAKLVQRDKTSGVHVFELPLGLITIRKGKRAANKTGIVRKGRPEGIALCGEATKSGGTCKGIAKKDTGKCAKHS